MRTILLVLLALVLVALQAAVLHWAGGGAIPLALPLVAVVHLGLTAPTVEGAVTSAGIGYVVDLSSAGPKGLLTSLAVGLYLFSRLAGASVDVHGRIGFAVLTAVGVFLYGAAALGLVDLVTPAEAAPRWALVGRVALEAAATGVASVWLLPVLRRIDGLFHREEPGLLR